MGQADNGHFGGHHRVRGKRHLFDGLQQHLPHPRQRPHRQTGSHVKAAGLFVGRGGRILGSRRVDLDDRNPVRDLGQIAQDGHRVGPVGILRRKLGQRRGGVAPHHKVEKVQRPAPVGKAQHRADLLTVGFARPMRDGLIHQAKRIADRPFGGAGDQGKGVRSQRDALLFGNPGKMSQHHFRLDPLEVEALAARQDSDRHLADLGRGHDELGVGARLFQRLEQGVEGV